MFVDCSGNVSEMLKMSNVKRAKPDDSLNACESHLLSELGFPLQSERNQLMSDTVPPLTVYRAVL